MSSPTQHQTCCSENWKISDNTTYNFCLKSFKAKCLFNKEDVLNVAFDPNHVGSGLAERDRPLYNDSWPRGWSVTFLTAPCEKNAGDCDVERGSWAMFLKNMCSLKWTSSSQRRMEVNISEAFWNNTRRCSNATLKRPHDHLEEEAFVPKPIQLEVSRRIESIQLSSDELQHQVFGQSQHPARVCTSVLLQSRLTWWSADLYIQFLHSGWESLWFHLTLGYSPPWIGPGVLSTALFPQVFLTFFRRNLRQQNILKNEGRWWFLKHTCLQDFQLEYPNKMQSLLMQNTRTLTQGPRKRCFGNQWNWKQKGRLGNYPKAVRLIEWKWIKNK